MMSTAVVLSDAGSNRLLRSQTLTVTFTKPFDSLVETVVAVRSTTDVSEQCSRWWRWAELNRRANDFLKCFYIG